MNVKHLELEDFTLLKKTPILSESEQTLTDIATENLAAANDLKPFANELPPTKTYTEDEYNQALVTARAEGYANAKNEIEKAFHDSLDIIKNDLPIIAKQLVALNNQIDTKLALFEQSLLALFKIITEKLGANPKDRLLDLITSVIAKNIDSLKASQELEINLSPIVYNNLCDPLIKAVEDLGIKNCKINQSLQHSESNASLSWRDGGIVIDVEKITNEIVKLLASVINNEEVVSN